MDNELITGAAILLGCALFYRVFVNNKRESQREWSSHVQEGLPEDQPWTVSTQTYGSDFGKVYLNAPH